MAQFTTEQFEQLMQAVGHYNVRSGSLSNCTARYAGERDSTKVEEFIAAVGTFKAVEKISDADAITGMPMILEGDAAEWWRGVQPKPKVFEDVVRMLREAFCPPKPDWRIYAEIVESKQAKNEPTDSFVRRKRALFSQLTNAPSEIGQIDLLFGMIHLQIRDRVSRKRITTFDDLLNEAREAEMTLREHKMTTANADKAVDSTSGPVRCGFCRKKGHYTEVCFKKKNEEAKTAQTQAIANALVTKPSYSCYGCNAPGVTRANCPKCLNKPSTSHGSVSFNSLTIPIGKTIPIANVQLFGMPGQIYFDSGARTSVASANLKRIMDFKGCTYRKVECEITLADGSTKLQRCLTTKCDIVIGGRSFTIQFMVLPDAIGNKTLLGTDFLEQAEIVLNMGQRYWYFENNPTQHFDFVDPLPLELNVIERVKVCTLVTKRKPEEAAVKEIDEPKVYMSEFEYYGPDLPNDYSPHTIQSIFRDAVPPNMITPERPKGPKLFTGVVYNQSTIDNVDLFSIDFQILKENDGLGLEVSEKIELDKVLQSHVHVFSTSCEPTPYAQHFIDTGEHEPIASPAYRLSFSKLKELKVEIRKMLENDVLEECESAWSSPVVMVPKKDGGTRVCVDYVLNAITKPERYPLARIDDLLHAAKSTNL